MPAETIISGQSLPVPERNPRGRLFIKLADGTGIRIPDELATADLSNARVRERVEGLLLDLGNVRDIIRLWLLLFELRTNGYTLAQAADLGGVNNALRSATYSIVRERP